MYNPLPVRDRARVSEGTIPLVPTDGVVKIGTDTRSAQTCARCENLITIWMATFQGYRVSRNSTVRWEMVHYSTIINIFVTPRSTTALASLSKKMITKMSAIPPTFPNGDQISVVTFYMIKDLFCRGVRNGM